MNNDRFEQMIDEALASCSLPEPPLGLESRVLARATAPHIPKGWFVLIAAAASLLIVLLNPVRRPLPPLPTVHLPQPAVPPIAQALERRVHRSPAPLPRLAAFPSRAPLTDNERALLRLVRDYPEQIAAIDHTAPQSIAIEPIHIALLQSKESPQ
jgi:hypothetical protein